MPDFGNYSLAEIAAQVMAQDARSISRASVPLLRDDEIVRGWQIARHLTERVRVFLDKYGEGGGYNPAAPLVECHAITNPAVDQGVSMSGTWRVVRNFEDPQLPGYVVQVLRRGWLKAPVLDTQAAWAAVDEEARIVRVREQCSEVAAAFGTYYVVMYKGVANDTVREFCERLPARPTLTNPTFGLQSVLTGSFRFQAARNDEQDDGSSIVVAYLTSTTVPDGVEHKLYSGATADEWRRLIYDAPAVPSVVGVTAPAGGAGAIEYRISSFSIDKETGLYDLVVTKRESKPLDAIFLIPDKDGAYTIRELQNQTRAELDAKITATCNPDWNNSVSTPNYNDFKLWDTTIITRPPKGATPDDDLGTWVQRNSYIEKCARYPEGNSVYKANGDPQADDPAKYNPKDCYYWRWVYEKAVLKLTPSAHGAELWATPDGGSSPCLPGSESRPARDGLFLGIRVVARHYSNWFWCSEKEIENQDVVLNTLGGVGSLWGGGDSSGE
jgi:hypothetical protein